MSTEPLNRSLPNPAGLPSFRSNPEFAGGRVENEVRRGAAKVQSAGGEKSKVIRNCEDRAQQPDLESVPGWNGMSAWSGSAAKRMFDCVCVLLSLPITLPLVLMIAVAVRLSSRGPVFFLQERMGRHGRTFTIFKFRTMVHVVGTPHRSIATPDGFTPVGRFLRRWKLDELPQLLNVLLGHMSLVGPRPKMREHVRYDLPCRPGITGMATIVFACEEDILASVAEDRLEEYFHAVVLPAKRHLDGEYMAQATFFSDFQLLVKSVLRHWDSAALEKIVDAAAFQTKKERARAAVQRSAQAEWRKPALARTARPVDAEEVSTV